MTVQVLFTRDGSKLYYPCHTMVVAMETSTSKQEFLLGHTEKVRYHFSVMCSVLSFFQISCVALSGNDRLLASGQAGAVGVVRVWLAGHTHCIALFSTRHQQLNWLRYNVAMYNVVMAMC